MRARASLLGLILGVPCLGFAVSTAVRSHLDSEVRAAIIERVADADRANVAQLTVGRLCEAPAPETASLCRTDANLALIRTASFTSGLVGMGLLGLITLAGVAAQSSRALLLALFRPGLYLTAVTITGLILAHAIIAVAIIYYGESAVANRVHFGVILLICLGAFGGVLAVARSAFGIVQKAETLAVGKAVSPEEAPGLWQLTDQVAQKLGALRPDHIVIGLDPTFFVTEANVNSLSGRLTGRTLFCSLPLARILTITEFAAIVGHELGHFRGEDTKFSEHFYPIYRGTTQAIESLQHAGGQGWGVVALLPAIAVFSFFLERFAVAENRHSRVRELAADHAGVEATSPDAMASALVKVHAFAGVWGAVENAAVNAVDRGQFCKNASALFADAVARGADLSAFDGIAETHSSHPTDSHPPLAARLSSLNTDLSSVSANALAVVPPEPAVNLVGSAETHEEELSEAYQMLLASRLGGDPASDRPTGAAGPAGQA